jgi:pimeloyl-ACP methyl ester carboxylesterase
MEPTITHQNASTEFVQADGIRYAYRRFGRPSTVPLVLLQHFRGNLDNWDPAFTDALAAEQEIILVDPPGVGASSGAPKHTVAETARSILAFLDALGLREIDLLGFSLGGFVAQDLALLRPWAIRRLVLVGTGPKGAPGMHGWRDDIQENSRHDEGSGEDLLYLFFAHTETSQAMGAEFLGRFLQRAEDRDPTPTLAVREAQYDAVLEWGIPDHAALQRLTGIACPTLILQGDDDQMIPTRLSHLMAGLIPDASIRIYPDAAHASIFQYPAEAAEDINRFLGLRRAEIAALVA